MRLTNLTWPKAQEYFEKNDMVLISCLLYTSDAADDSVLV